MPTIIQAGGCAPLTILGVRSMRHFGNPQSHFSIGNIFYLMRLCFEQRSESCVLTSRKNR